MRASTFYKKEGHEVEFIKGLNKDREKIDLICITSLFTYWHEDVIKTIKYYQKYYPKTEIRVGGIFASLMKDHVEKHTGIKPHYGLVSEWEACPPDCDGFPPADYSITFTSRGCVNKCAYCVVPKLEGEIQCRDWIADIDTNKKTIIFLDNNWLAKPQADFEEDVRLLKSLCSKGIKRIDFNQSLDARLFTEERATSLIGTPFGPLRFAWDHKDHDGHVPKAIKLAQKLKICRKGDWKSQAFYHRAAILVLYNFNERPQEFYHRIREIISLGASACPMKFAPIDSLEKAYVGKHWTKNQVHAVKKIAGNQGIIHVESKQEFESMWGKDEKEFMRIINYPVSKLSLLVKARRERHTRKNANIAYDNLLK